ncbi:hypothetical protein [Chloroflexus sp.]|uniref:hypothetical protein n=1 Tax=Chloroflexus sp. TaxID=1904827 RepID=UPI00404B3719
MMGALCLALWPATPTPAQTTTLLPVFRWIKLPVSNDTTQQLGGLLEGIGCTATAG